MVAFKIFVLIFFPALMFFVSAGVNSYIVHRDLNRILDNFRGSVIISSYGDMWRDGSFLTRCTLSYIVMGSVIFPGKHIRSGMLDPIELARLPAAIRLRMKLSAGFLVGAFLWVILAVVVMELLKRT